MEWKTTGMSNPNPSPSTRYGAPGGPDPVTEGRKGGTADRGISPLDVLMSKMSKAEAGLVADAALRAMKDGDFQHFKHYCDRRNGTVVQETDIRFPPARTVVLEPGDGTVVEPPEEGA